MKQAQNKLVRDKIPEIIRAEGRTATTRTLEEREYFAELVTKLHEEANEFGETKHVEELADILEVLNAITHYLGTDLFELERLRAAKYLERGGFEHKVFLVNTDTPAKRGPSS